MKEGPLRIRLAVAFLVFLTAVTGVSAAEDDVIETHGLSLFNNLKYGPDFKHFDYVNPDAPKGGQVSYAATANDFDSLNPFIVKGTPAQDLGLMYDTLLADAFDEPSTMYGLIAESVEYPEDKSWVIFNLREEARFHDGHPIRAEDVVFSFNILKEKGAPFYRLYYENVTEAEVLSPQRVKFTFDQAGNRELPLIVGQLTVLPKHYWQKNDFAATTLEPPLGSGPYRIAEVDAGRSITYERVADYWAKDLPVNRGRYNFERITIEYFRDDTVELQAFKAGEYDFRRENTAKNWATSYDFPAVNQGRIKKVTLPDGTVQSMQGFVFNTRREKFADRRVRAALSQAMDFQWLNKNIFYGQYTRTDSYFDNSELASRGLPDGEELALLKPYKDQLPPEVFNQEYEPPTTEGAGSIRRNLRKAQKMLREAGWRVRDGVLTHMETGREMRIEFLLNNPSFERIVGPYIRNLEKLGVEASIRVVDSAQYRRRLDTFDFDVTVANFAQSLSPGNEQRDFWGSKAAEREGSRNIAGIQDPVVDAMIKKIVFAQNRKSLVTAVRALDRVLLWGHYVVPHWHIPYHRVAYWDKFGRPEEAPEYALGFPSTWWYDSAKADRLEKGSQSQ